MNLVWFVAKKVASALCVAAISLAVQAGDLDAALNKSILDALAHDSSRTGTEKLFDNRCKTIRETVGFEDSIDGKAREYSCDVDGIGITLYAGEDLGKHKPETVAKHFTDYLSNKRGLHAKAFIQRGHPYGTSMAFYINGSSWLFQPVKPMKGIEKLDALAAEAKLILLTDERVDGWIHDPET